MLLCPWGFSRQEYWSGLPCPPPEDPPNSGIEPRSPSLLVDSLPSKPRRKPSVYQGKNKTLLQFYSKLEALKIFLTLTDL